MKALSITSHVNCIAPCLINVVYLTASGHDDAALFNDVANDADSNQHKTKTKNTPLSPRDVNKRS